MNRNALIQDELILPCEVKALLAVLRSARIEGCAVGGCVRDLMRGVTPHDWDAAAAAPPEVLRELLETSGYRVIPTGIKHGTLTVLCPSVSDNVITDKTEHVSVDNGLKIELTSYRRESGYSDRRHPDSVEFTDSLDEDLARRDFTINAMAYLDGVGVYDPYSGRPDLESHIIRAVGEPERRFGEDALRILRGLRFASQLGFDIEPDTLAAMYSCRELLSGISAERVRDELLKLIRGIDAERVIRAHHEIVHIVLPELDLPSLSAGAELLSALNRMYSVNTVDTVSDAVRLAALLSSLSAADTVTHRLRLDKRTSRRVNDIITHFEYEYRDRVSVKRLCSHIGTDAAHDVLTLSSARGTASPEAFGWLAEIIEKGECISLSGLKLKGDALLRLGAEPTDCKKLLCRVLDEVIDGRLENEPECLLTFAARLINAEKSTCDN